MLRGINCDHHAWQIPIKTFSPACKDENAVQIPDPEIFRGISIAPSRMTLLGNVDVRDMNRAELLYPLSSHLATHLCLVECFHKLRAEAMQSRELDALITALPTAHTGDSIRQQRWEAFVKLAVARFDIWWQNIDRVLRHAKAYMTHNTSTLPKEYLPPLDVLLVWYGSMLQPSSRSGGAIPVPWKALHEVIDRNAVSYNLPPAAANLFRTVTLQSADIFTYLTSPPPYTESSTCDSRRTTVMELEKAVHMQDDFFDTTHQLLWLRAPSCSASLGRCLRRYKHFLHLMDLHPDKRGTLVPPWDVDLAWRTHRLYPDNYQSFVEQRWGGHPIPTYTESTATLSEEDPTETTSRLSNQHSKDNTPFSYCFCWACESVKDVSERAKAKPTKRNLKKMEKDLIFYAAVERARRAGERLPSPKERSAKKQKEDKGEIDRAAGYHEVVRLARKEKRKVVREKTYTAKMNWMMGF